MARIDPFSAAAPLFDARSRVTRPREAGNEKYIAECAAKPIDDAAWAKELERRAKIERWWSGGYGLGAAK